ncbi:MAG: hypothetical protein ACRDYY_00170 [Acidimicrobiales bacterium]
MAWLLRDGDVLAALEDRRRGWQSTLQGALVLTPPAFVQTMTRSSGAGGLDVAWCKPATLDGGDAGFLVVRIAAVRPRRAAAPRLGARTVVVAPAGTFERWRLRVGDHLEVRGP